MLRKEASQPTFHISLMSVGHFTQHRVNVILAQRCAIGPTSVHIPVCHQADIVYYHGIEVVKQIGQISYIIIYNIENIFFYL